MRQPLRRQTFAALSLAALVLAGCASEPPLTDTGPPVVTVAKPLERTITDYDQYTGHVEAAETVEVRARVRGELIGIHFKDGEMVKAGQLLYEIDPRTYQAALDLATAKKGVALANKKLADSEYDREYALYTRKSTSARDVEIWAAKKGIALGEIGAADAEIARTKLDLEFTKIKAPITGKISRSLVTKGNLVNAGGGDTLLTTIVSIDPIYVYFDVDERSLELYRERRARELGIKSNEVPSIPVWLGLINDRGLFPREGKLDFAENKINPSTGTIRARAVFHNPDGRLTPGQFARVKLPVGEKYPGLLVIDSAIGIDQGQKYLLIVNDKNKVEYRPVAPGRLEGGLRIFPPGAGLKAGEWVIVNGVQRVRPGIEVRPEKLPRMPAPPTSDANGQEKSKEKAKPKT